MRASSQDEATTGNWYLAQLKPGGLQRARVNLERQKFGTFMPMRPETRRRAGRLQTQLHPLFPGYLFVHLDPGCAPWRKIDNTYGVSRLVRLSGQTPSIVPPGLMDTLFAASRDGLWSPSELEVGTSARLVTGPFAGALAKIEATPEGGRVMVLLEMMGQAVRTTVALRALEPA